MNHVVGRTLTLTVKDGRFGSKVGQVGPKWDKSGAFSDQISVHLVFAYYYVKYGRSKLKLN